MNIAVFFQKHNTHFFVRCMEKIYESCFLRTNKNRIKYLRDCGAKIGEGVTINNVGLLGTEPYLCEIGDNVFFSGNRSNILTHDGSVGRLLYMAGYTDKIYDCFGKVKIGNNCFIGINCIIMKGVQIGDNCIIGAGSVVTKSIPSNSIACGVPAKVISNIEVLFEKNKDFLDDTVGMNIFQKRQYIVSNMDKYYLRIKPEK